MDITIKKFAHNYGADIIFSDFNLSFKENSITCILGGSGVGKTTLLHSLADLLDCQGELSKPANISYIFQESRLIPWLSIKDNLSFALSCIKMEDKDAQINSILTKVGLGKYIDSFPKVLSGGMLQRVSIARAFLFPSQAILMDEPFKALDIGNKREMLSLLLKLLKDTPKTIISVTHDIYEALEIADRIIVLKNRPVNIVLDEYIEEPRGQRDIFSDKYGKLKRAIFDKF